MIRYDDWDVTFVFFGLKVPPRRWQVVMCAWREVFYDPFGVGPITEGEAMTRVNEWDLSDDRAIGGPVHRHFVFARMWRDIAYLGGDEATVEWPVWELP